MALPIEDRIRVSRRPLYWKSGDRVTAVSGMSGVPSQQFQPAPEAMNFGMYYPAPGRGDPFDT